DPGDRERLGAAAAPSADGPDPSAAAPLRPCRLPHPRRFPVRYRQFPGHVRRLGYFLAAALGRVPGSAPSGGREKIGPEKPLGAPRSALGKLLEVFCEITK